MGDCELLTGCIFFNDTMANMPVTAEMMKTRFCRGDSGACARHMVYEKFGRERVPADLSPNDPERARLILASG